MNTETLPRPTCEADAGRNARWIVISKPAGFLWFGGWLFTIGFAGLTFWKAVLALVIWPYFLGVLAS